MGITSNSFFRIKTGELKSVCKKNVSKIDWWEEAIKNFLSTIIFSLPLTIILVDKNTCKQKEVQWPIILPPNKTIFLGSKIAGRNKKEIRIIPMKKKRENKKLLIIFIKN